MSKTMAVLDSTAKSFQKHHFFELKLGFIQPGTHRGDVTQMMRDHFFESFSDRL